MIPPTAPAIAATIVLIACPAIWFIDAWMNRRAGTRIIQQQHRAHESAIARVKIGGNRRELDLEAENRTLETDLLVYQTGIDVLNGENEHLRDALHVLQHGDATERTQRDIQSAVYGMDGTCERGSHEQAA